MSFFSIVKNNKNPHSIDNANRIARILYRLKPYRKIFLNAFFAGVHLVDLFRTQFPFIFRDAIVPPIISIELTNCCDVACRYCFSPISSRSKGYMSREVFMELREEIKNLGVNRVRLVGMGEATLHPDFTRISRELRKVTSFLSIVTNGQWKNENIADVLTSCYDLIEISVDGKREGDYEKVRIGASFERLLHNLNRINYLKMENRARVLINLRLMLHPSTDKRSEKKLIKYWSKDDDTVMVQYLLQRTEDSDTYTSVYSERGSWPRCSLIFKYIEISYEGKALYCGPEFHKTGNFLGYIQQESLHTLWNSDAMRKLRNGHRDRKFSDIEMCKGCEGQ